MPTSSHPLHPSAFMLAMRRMHFIGLLMSLGSAVANIASDCIKGQSPGIMTCFAFNWPVETICPNHPYNGLPHDYMSGQQIKEIIADPNHQKPKCVALKENQAKARCDYTVQLNHRLPGPDKGYTFLWTYLTLGFDGNDIHEFGGLYWRQVSFGCFFDHPLMCSPALEHP